MRGSYWAGIVALLLMPNSSLQIAHAQGGHSEIVCWGENENGCSAHEYTYHAPCGFLGYGGARRSIVTVARTRCEPIRWLQVQNCAAACG